MCLCLLIVFIVPAIPQITDADCVTAEGDVGHCIAPSECIPSYNDERPILCRYSKGYGMRICCPYSSIRSHYKYGDEHDELYSDDDLIAFPSEPFYSDFHPFIKHDAHFHHNKPSFPEDSYHPHHPRPSHNRPHYHEKHRPPHGFHGNPSHSHGDHERPDNYRPKPPIWEVPEDEASWEDETSRRQTPRPTWAVEDRDRQPSSNSKKRISERKCEEYSKLVTQTIDVLPLSLETETVPLKVQKCDFSAVKLIVGGEASELGEFPHMAALGFLSPGPSQGVIWNCGGTLISDRYVMTAGHCANTSYGNPVVVRLGEYNLASENDGAEPEDYKIERIITHPNYFKSLKYNDIALIRLSKAVKYNKWIRPACLPSSNTIRGKPTATGWGRTDFVGKQSERLMKVTLSVIDNRLCNTFYNSNNPGSVSFSSGIVDTMICAGELEGGRDTCLGDSGGPLSVTQKDNPCVHYVVGITSFGKICGAPRAPGVYTRVSKYLPWIERIVWS